MKPHVVLGMTLLIVAVLWFGGATPALAQATAPSTPGITIDGEYGPFLPTDISEHGYQVDRLIHVVHVFMIALFVGWGIFFVFCLVRFRQRPGHKANPKLVKASISKYLEIGVAAFEAVLLLGLSMPLWASVKNDVPDRDDPDALRIRVVAEQFQWSFHYPGKDGVFGKTEPKAVNTAMNPLGLIAKAPGREAEDPAGADDIVSPELHIPAGRKVACDLTSKDVIHSFFLPVMRIKQDAIPGMRIPVWFQSKPDAVGNYEVACAQLCGNNHYSMRALMVVESEEDFQAWLKEKGKGPEVFDEDAFD